MAKQIINVGTSANDGTGDKNRVAFQKCNSNFDELYADGGKGTLQQVTDNGNTITSGDFQANFEASAIEVTNQLTGTGTSIDATEGVVIKTGSFQGKIKTDNLTAVRTNQLPDKNITFAGIDDIPTDLSELNDDATHRLVTDTQISTWDGKQNALTETNFGSFINSLTAKNTLVDADEVVSDDSADSNKAKKTTWLNVWTNYLKVKTDALYAVPCIKITTSTSIDTDTASSGYGQHGRNVKIANSTNAINLTVQTSSNADFVASYTKIGTAAITFVAGSGATLVQMDGTAILSGAVGSSARLTREGNTYYLDIQNK